LTSMVAIRSVPGFHFLVVVALLLSSLSLAAAYPEPVSTMESKHLTAIQLPEIDHAYHKLTVAEMNSLRDAFGVRDPSLDYNVVVDGHGTGLAPPSEESWESMVGIVNVLDSVDSDLSSVPASFDLSSLPTFPAVGDQASQPSCAAWAGTYYAYGFAEASDLEWTGASSGAPDQLVSPAWTYNRVNGGRDSGSWTDENMFVVRDWGVATLAKMPFDDSEYLDLGSPSAFREAPEHRADDVFYIPYSGSATIDEIKVLVSEGTLVTFALDALQFPPGFKDGTDGDYVLSAAEYSSSDLNHAQTIVGFDDSVADDGETGAFRVVNSWGAEWGDEGFYWFTYEALLELGSMDVLYLNYITDIPDYSPQLVAAWHFNAAPSRSADLEVGLGSSITPIVSKSPFFSRDRTASHLYPTYMCLDVSEFADDYDISDGSFFLDIGSSPSKGVVSSFKVECYTGVFVPGAAARTTAQSEDVPKTTPGTVSVTLPQHEPVSVSEALDSESLSFIPLGEVQWVGVNHASAGDGDSIQSGDVGDGETTQVAVSVSGPGQVSFMWKVSSQSGSDTLSFEIPEVGVSESISGDHDWSEMFFSIDEGAHTLIWSYSKDSSVSELDDTAWVDSVRISTQLPDFSLEQSYAATSGMPVLVTPLDITNPMSSELEFWFDWGDDSPLDQGDPEEGYSASHIYAESGRYTLVVNLEDEYSYTVVRAAEVEVDDQNARPTIHSATVSPSSDYHEPGSTVTFNVAVSDLEGDSVSVSVEVSTLEAVMEETMAADPGESMLFSFDYTCPLGSEVPYLVLVTASDDAEHSLQGDWDSASLTMLVNSLPVAQVESGVTSASTGEPVSFDASGSYDAESASASLEFRWDWESDGVWDTGWSSDASSEHAFMAPGTYVVSVEVKDANSLAASSSVEVAVTGDPIPEFSLVLVPVIAILVVFAAARRRRS
jgi:C1A family cysteine protease